ncbi:hypothetical protein DSL72_003897 [Monilinia vaccinii-corymbosi]|uniref:Forkhead box protein O n=1 Tax=Monilinia vaccinii-corymbosi TaxID=61207 RepID=A0A8A3NV75_9HELO|nr:hypothetical protein DSL72_003897 [Monilinia vaccinii-corymbosi]
MDLNHFQQNIQNQDFAWDFQASGDIEMIAQSQAADIFPSFDGLPRIGQDQYFMAGSSSPFSMLQHDYTRTASQMPGLQTPDPWAHQAPVTPSFGGDGNAYSYNVAADLSGLEHLSLKSFDDIPRTTWQQPYPSMTMTLPFHPFDTRDNLASMVSSKADHGERLDDCVMTDNAHMPLTSNTPSSLSSEEYGQSSREPTAMVIDARRRSLDQLPYAKLIHRALMSTPDHAMVLQEIYRWFRENSKKVNYKGWKNSVRHNLSMNAAFIKTDRKAPGEKTKKSAEWVLEDFAIKRGVQSTTRYRREAAGAKADSAPKQKKPSRKRHRHAVRKSSLHSAAKAKRQRQKKRKHSASRRMLPKSSGSEPAGYPGSYFHTSNMTSDAGSPRRSPLTPAPETFGTYSPAIKEESYTPAYGFYRFEDSQGVLPDDQGPLFMHHQNTQFMQVHPMCASNPYLS